MVPRGAFLAALFTANAGHVQDGTIDDGHAYDYYMKDGHFSGNDTNAGHATT